jgi:hypothetical protein
VNTKFVAREYELTVLAKAIASNTSSFIVTYGRRRIGKTETILQFCKKYELSSIEFTGKYKASRSSQIKSFMRQISKQAPSLKNRKVDDWMDAFEVFKEYLDTISEDNKFVIFIDELPWLDTQKSGLVTELGDFWNLYASRKPNIILIVCGSAASYMLKKVIKNKGPLHGRITQKLPMEEFNLADTKRFLIAKGCAHYSNKSIVDTYMAIGGVAKYLQALDCSKTPSQALQELCFDKTGLLIGEYEELFTSLFNNANAHMKIMGDLSSRWKGKTKTELANSIGVSKTYIKNTLDELLASGFVSQTPKFGNRHKESIYAATDFFSYFHNRWMSGTKKVSNWSVAASSQDFAIWSGYAFEKLCHTHLYQITKALGINGVPTSAHYWSYAPGTGSDDETGAQIDLLLSHDNSRDIDIIECKYYKSEFTISKKYKDELINKREVFNRRTNNKYNVRLIIITPYGIKSNSHYNEVSPVAITLDALFEVGQ